MPSKERNYHCTMSTEFGMDPVQREVLDMNFNYLVESLRGTDVLSRLRTDEVINKYDYDQLRRTEPQGSKAFNRLLILTLRRRGVPHAYASLHRALRENGQDDVCDVMLDCELALRDGLASDRLRKELSAYPHLKSVNGYSALDPAMLVHSGSSESPILNKATSPAFRASSTTSPTPRDSHGRHDSVSSRDRKSPSPLKKQQQHEEQQRTEDDKEKERQLLQLQREVAEMRSSHSKMETELRLQIHQLEKDRDVLAAKKSSSCVVM